jgi:hypothetical protein
MNVFLHAHAVLYFCFILFKLIFAIHWYFYGTKWFSKKRTPNFPSASLMGNKGFEILRSALLGKDYVVYGEIGCKVGASPTAARRRPTHTVLPFTLHQYSLGHVIKWPVLQVDSSTSHVYTVLA